MVLRQTQGAETCVDEFFCRCALPACGGRTTEKDDQHREGLILLRLNRQRHGSTVPGGGNSAGFDGFPPSDSVVSHG